MLENAKRPIRTEQWDEEQESLASPVASVAPKSITSATVDQSDKVGYACMAVIFGASEIEGLTNR